jgi:nitronate monooxygenase
VITGVTPRSVKRALVLPDLPAPVIGAPMAGGPSTPALAAAVTNAGGLGFLAGGLVTADALAQSLTAARTLASDALGVNLFVPQASVATSAELARYADTLADDAARYGVAVGEPRHDDDDWDAKLTVVCDLRPEVVSFTFGSPGPAVCRRLTELGILPVVTVTSVAEADCALGHGAGALVAQGPAAGGHRGTFDPLAAGARESLTDLVTALAGRVDVPVVAAGGLGTREAAHEVRQAGATAVQLGTALLLADEAGTHPVHRAALQDPQFTETVVTRAFTGRWARTLRNRFADLHDGAAVAGFPEIGRMTAPLQGAAAAAGDPHGVSLWAGTAFRAARRAPAAEIVAAQC